MRNTWIRANYVLYMQSEKVFMSFRSLGHKKTISHINVIINQPLITSTVSPHTNVVGLFGLYSLNYSYIEWTRLMDQNTWYWVRANVEPKRQLFSEWWMDINIWFQTSKKKKIRLTSVKSKVIVLHLKHRFLKF